MVAFTANVLLYLKKKTTYALKRLHLLQVSCFIKKKLPTCAITVYLAARCHAAQLYFFEGIHILRHEIFELCRGFAQ